MGFQKGQSGNPGGKSKELKGIQELARKHAPQALNALVKVATSGKSESARVSAASALLDRGFGKPAQALEHTGKDGGPIKGALVGVGINTTDPAEASRIYQQIVGGE